MSALYSNEKQVAIAAVRRACILTNSVFNKLVKNETLTKDDKSPVTVGDYAAQAVINTILSKAFPDDPIVGEESSSDLRTPSSSSLRSRVIELANEALQHDLAPGDSSAWGIGPGATQSEGQLLETIDRGSFAGGKSGRMWTLDPIDGTKGFLRGGQYAVCLALLVDSRVELGVIGCPNLPVDPSKPDGARGCLFIAVRGQGAEQLTLSGSDPKTLSIPAIASEDISNSLSFLESVEAAHSSHGFNSRVSDILGLATSPVRMDSQAKYCCLARGEGGAYLRMPTGAGYREKIWDHAPGSLLVTEAGGAISDSRGQPLDFGLGRDLGENFGVVAAGKSVQADVLAAVKKAGEEEKSKA
ncbi:3(2),5-bisphosphate nucleotidase HAL2 [Athelia psychrophila]|uniref:3'(2'),5'-bisphosphate nucleotidase n=1 Tax=Athelia psychrophila TaxID=1759441 RepID=A0A167XBP5_9AGAM|nr:3(2),5-bisphosphate nucleotidase HAL2 [Fibularhizoctonia sp. CBS 109695]